MTEQERDADRLRAELEAILEPFGQTHVLRFWRELTPAQRTGLAEQVRQVDWALLDRLVRADEAKTDFDALARRAEPPPAIRLDRDPAERPALQDAIGATEELLAAGRVGAILVAGGQGTRLGFPHPKGMFPIGPVSRRTLFQMHIDQLRALAERFGRSVPLYLMTSPATHDETLAFLVEHDRFGLSADDLFVFCQGTMPVVDFDGRVLMASKDSLVFSPDGHGGMLAAFRSSGAMQDAVDRGLTQLFYFQVDNPLVRVADRELLGFHQLVAAEMSTQVVAKRDPTERVGNVVQVDGRLMVIEYSDLSPEAAAQRNPDGSLKLWAGSIAVHGFALEFLCRAASVADTLPFHRARKRVPAIDDRGRCLEPKGPNAIKFERFIFDLMPHAERAIVVEADPAEVFAPVKNASGEKTDTPETSRAAIVARAKRWLREAGARVDESAAVEISPFVAMYADDLLQKVPVGWHIQDDTFITPDVLDTASMNRR